MKNKLLSILTAGVMLSSAAAIPPVYAESEYESKYDSIIGILPDWTPMNFADAMQFYNTHGKSHVEDNYICLVKPIQLAEKDTYRTSFSGSMVNINTPCCTSRAIFELEIPEMPSPDDEEALAEYEEYCNKLGLPTDDYTIFENFEKYGVDVAFEVQMFRVLEGYDLTVKWLRDYGDNYKKIVMETFTFENPSGYVEQTDIYSWLPDCPAEYNWLESYSNDSNRACVYYNPYTYTPYITYCANVPSGTGASLTMEQTGDGKITELMESNCDPFELYITDGGMSRSVLVYEPIADGLVDVEWSIGREWSAEPPYETSNGTYHIKNNCTEIVDLSNGSTIITFIDKYTGELIDIPEDSSFVKSTIQHSPDEPLLDELFPVTSNPCIIDSTRAYDPNCSYSFDIRTEDGCYEFRGFEVTSDNENCMKLNCYLVYRKYNSDLPDYATRIFVYDEDTGKLIPDEVIKNHNFYFGTNIGFKNPNVTGGWMYTGPIYAVDSNPMILENDQLANFYQTADLFEFTTEDEPDVIVYENGSMDIFFKTKLKVSGNINGDGKLTIADAVTLQKWLTGAKDVEIYDWQEGDYDLDNMLTVFDLNLMKRELIKQSTTVVQPEIPAEYSVPLEVIAEELPLYLGPDTSYPVVASIPRYELIREMGYNRNNNYWMYTEYNGQSGWIRIYEEDNETRTVYFEPTVDKPVIYLYPEQETDVRVELELTEADLSTTYPKYNNGWDVTAYPDGTLLNKADGTHHKYLFWDAKNCRTRFDYSKGFCVAGSDTESFLREKLTYMGLTEQEMNEFIVYWLPLMEHNKYNLIAFQGDEYTDSAKLNITPEPESMLRIFMTYIPLEAPVDIEPQQLETFERKGFTVVEWGGALIEAELS